MRRPPLHPPLYVPAGALLSAGLIGLALACLALAALGG